MVIVDGLVKYYVIRVFGIYNNGFEVLRGISRLLYVFLILATFQGARYIVRGI